MNWTNLNSPGHPEFWVDLDVITAVEPHPDNLRGASRFTHGGQVAQCPVNHERLLALIQCKVPNWRPCGGHEMTPIEVPGQGIKEIHVRGPGRCCCDDTCQHYRHVDESSVRHFCQIDGELCSLRQNVNGRLLRGRSCLALTGDDQEGENDGRP